MNTIAGNIKEKSRNERLREFFEKLWRESANYGERLELLFTLCKILNGHGIQTHLPPRRDEK